MKKFLVLSLLATLVACGSGESTDVAQDSSEVVVDTLKQDTVAVPVDTASKSGEVVDSQVKEEEK